MKKLLIASLMGLGALTAKAADIVDTAVAAGSFKTLVAAVQAAGLVETLKGPGPFTVFAPTDEAFALFANTALLTAVLTYHVVPSRVFKAQVPVGTPITTLHGATFTVGSDLAITDQAGRKANIVATDVMTSNGVIHVIDKVILPLAPA